MIWLRRTPTLLVIATALLTAAPAAAQSVEELVGAWQPPRGARLAEVKTRALGQRVVDGAWIQLTIRDEHGNGRGHDEMLMLRQAPDGTVRAHRFAAGQERSSLLTGRWTSADRLELEGDDPETTWTWIRESACRVTLHRSPAVGGAAEKAELGRAECDEKRDELAAAPPTTEAGAPTPDGRPADAKPGTVVAAPEPEPRDQEMDEMEERAVAAEPGGAEVDVSDLPATRAAPPAPARTRTDAGAVTEASRTVILSGRGKPYDEVKKAIDMLRQFLRDQGVAVEAPSDEIVVLQAADSSLAYLVRETRDRNAASLLYVTAAFGGRERIIVECYDPNGLLLWREKIVGGTGIREFKWVNDRLVKRMQERLTPRLGGVGLPLETGSGASP